MTAPRIPADSSRPSQYTVTSGLDLLDDWAEHASQPQKNTVYRTLFAVADQSVYTTCTVVYDPASPLDFFVLAKNDLAVKIHLESVDAFAILYIGPSATAPGFDAAPPAAVEVVPESESNVRF
ncbi:MAG: DUF6235 family protein [Streptosporangiaceae bacterium]|jgi:hypothetical protein